MLIFFSMFYPALAFNETYDLFDVLSKSSILSIIWPGFFFVLLLLVDFSSNAFFLAPFGSSQIFLIISLILKYKYDFSFSKVFIERR